MLTEMEAAIQANAWVRDELERNTCLSDDDSQKYAEGFVAGMMHGLKKGGQGSLVIQGDTAEAFWRGNLRTALAWERSITGNSDDDEEHL